MLRIVLLASRPTTAGLLGKKAAGSSCLGRSPEVGHRTISSSSSRQADITLTIDGKEVTVPQGSALIQACELAGAAIPRFCYHDRLAIAGNCRMCLVEVERSPKPVASCAMPAMPGSKVFTNTPLVHEAREGVMEFLLANHPLDCPICDQGGECDLQDQSMRYGSDRSRFHEITGKRAVENKDLGPLVKTSMNRCIQCTRCVRFANEVAGVEDLGTTGRGNDMQIGMYVEKTMHSELSGNVIDLCPVGALTSKPYAFHARPWELKNTESIDVMDAVGSNIRVDSRGVQVMRIQPRTNDDINEEWISDKTRYAYDGLRFQRLTVPLVKQDDRFVPVSWPDALAAVATGISRSGAQGDEIQGVAGHLADTESMVALKDLVNRLGSDNLTLDQPGGHAPPVHGIDTRSSYLLNCSIPGVEQADVILLVGTNPRHEAAVLNSRIRKSWLHTQLEVGFIGERVDTAYGYDYLGHDVKALANFIAGKIPFADKFKAAKKPLIIVGSALAEHKDGAAVYNALAKFVEKNRSKLITPEWNGFSVLQRVASRPAAYDIGFVPSKRASLVNPKFIYLLNADEIDPGLIPRDSFVVYQGHHGDLGAQLADVCLPAAAYTEKSSTWVNTEGRSQLGRAAVPPPGASREDWKIIRAVSEVVGCTLPYDDNLTLRDRMWELSPTLPRHDVTERTSAEVALLGLKLLAASTAGSKAAGLPFQKPIDNFYQTDPISRASVTMAQCTRAFVTGESYGEVHSHVILNPKRVDKLAVVPLPLMIMNPSSVAQTSNATQRTPRQYRRPSSIAELASRAKAGLYDDRRDLKHHLRAAEKNRTTAKESHKAGDLETAFVEYAKAATLVLEKVPTHRDYHTLTSEQQRNLGLNGHDILDRLSNLKPALVERYERWHAAHPEARDLPSTSNTLVESTVGHRDGEQKNLDVRQRQNSQDSRWSNENARRSQAQAEARQRVQEEIWRRNEQELKLAEELELLKQQNDQAARHFDDMGKTSARSDESERKRREESTRRHDLDLTFGVYNTAEYNRTSRSDEVRSNDYPVPDSSTGVFSRRSEEVRPLQQQQQQHMLKIHPEDFSRREEEVARRRMEERRKAEQDGIARRQKEAEAAAWAERQSIDGHQTTSIAHFPYQTQGISATPAVRAPKAVSSRPASFLHNTYPEAAPMPLESPTRYEGDSTDSEAVGDGPNSFWRHVRGSKHNNGAPSKAPARSPIYPPPITTTSPPPSDFTIRYPEIMSQHQKLQGYVPSLHSMFNPMMRPPTVPSSLLFEAEPQSTITLPSRTNYNRQVLYPADMLPQPSRPVQNTQSQYPYLTWQPHRQHPAQSQQLEVEDSSSAMAVPSSSTVSQTRNATPPPRQDPDASRIIRSSSSSSRPTDPVTRELKTVNLPRECLPRFLSIAALNTSRNKETCGLLLGKDKEKKFVVTTLLIPKQHSTSDTCTMDEEELVLKFTEERSLITLGWIHTHPSQSCFMSSVDLHTHSGFQRMLPESFAVVCAPKSNPNFGVFRLTDPPGLQAILDCNAKEAFHPHPDMPIYTDADKGHVQMKDISLEIVDLR